MASFLLPSSLCCLLVAFIGLRWRQSRIYARLHGVGHHLKSHHADTNWFDLPSEVPDFGSRLVRIPDLLCPETLARFQTVVCNLKSNERSYVPGHKQGGTISYVDLHTCAPELVAFYRSAALSDLIARVVGVAVEPTPLHDQSSCSLLIYEKPCDHIGWHFDHNFYSGRHFTVLLSLVNHDYHTGGLSSARLQANIDGQEVEVPTPANTLVIFEGEQILHRATKLGSEQVRILLSMTFTTDPRAPWYKALMRRGKDMAYYGIRALWT